MSATRVIDSHTGGEPTRVVVAGGPDVAGRAPAAAREWLQREQDAWRRAIVCEPRGNDVVVGAYLLPPTRSDCVAGAVFFNNVGYLGMCGHGTIGVAQTLHHLGRIHAGKFQLETPVGVVEVDLAQDGRVTIANVASYRHARKVALDVPGLGRVHGDIAWGGNWFFLVDDHGLAVAPDNIDALMRAASAIRRALDDAGIGGRDGGVIDHVELLAADTQADSRNFVLCPGFAYDRSPCGTGTSAKLACLAAEGKLAAGAVWRQRSVIGSEFQAWYQRLDEETILPYIAGRAHVVAEAVLHFDPADPFAWGLA